MQVMLPPREHEIDTFPHECDQLPKKFMIWYCGDTGFYYLKKWGVELTIKIDYCPFCGELLE